jgi:hypothetical protein
MSPLLPLIPSSTKSEVEDKAAAGSRTGIEDFVNTPFCMPHIRRVAFRDPIGRLCRTRVQRMKRGQQREKENWKKRVEGRPEKGERKLVGRKEGWKIALWRQPKSPTS